MKDSARNLTVEEILKTPYFEHAFVAAGHSGLQKQVTWAHILEITDCKDYVNGNELVLTTGIGWKEQNELLLFMKNLISQNVTALCLQLGLKFNHLKTIDDLPIEVLEEAERNNFPLILFPEEHDCRYVDLIKNLHSMFINRGYKTFLDQESFLNKLYLLLVNHHDTDDILYFIHKHLNIGVAYKAKGAQTLFIPKGSSAARETVDNLLAECKPLETTIYTENNIQIAARQVNACSQELGVLALYSNNRPLNEFDYLVLEKCALTLAQEFIGDLYLKEKEIYAENKWITDWVNGTLKEHEITQHIKDLDPFIKPNGCLACLVRYAAPYQKGQNANESAYHITGISRTIFEQNGFHLFLHNESRSIIFILINTLQLNNWKDRMRKALQSIQEVVVSSNFHDQNKSISFYNGKMIKNLNDINKSLEAAKETLHIKSKHLNSNINFFDDLHIFRIIMMLDKQGELESFVYDYFEPLMNDDHKPNPVLISTLKVLRDCQYNKKDAAKKLFIARQSLYQRIGSLEDIFGDDFMASAEKRICLEIALYGLDFIGSKIEREYTKGKFINIK